MPSSAQWAAFLLASILFIQVPGPSLLFILGRVLTVGLRRALLSVVGNAAGLATQALLVAVGLGALVAASATAYTGLKVIGACYVIWLGIRAIRHRGAARAALAAPTPEPAAGASLLVGYTVGVTNPKTVVFMVAFLPQFTDPGAPAMPQIALLGLVFAVLACASDSIWAAVAGRARRWLAREPRRLDVMGATGGVMLVGLGTTMLVRH